MCLTGFFSNWWLIGVIQLFPSNGESFSILWQSGAFVLPNSMAQTKSACFNGPPAHCAGDPKIDVERQHVNALVKGKEVLQIRSSSRLLFSSSLTPQGSHTICLGSAWLGLAPLASPRNYQGQFRANATCKRALPGLNAAAVGLLCAALVQMGAAVREKNTKPLGPSLGQEELEVLRF